MLSTMLIDLCCYSIKIKVIPDRCGGCNKVTCTYNIFSLLLVQRIRYRYYKALAVVFIYRRVNRLTNRVLMLSEKKYKHTRTRHGVFEVCAYNLDKHQSCSSQDTRCIYLPARAQRSILLSRMIRLSNIRTSVPS